MTASSQTARETRVPMAVIQRYARRIAERFRPNQIILFGSYANGEPTADSDVDLLVVMPARNQLDQAARIRIALPAPFAMDLLVRTPKRWQDRLEMGESFTKEIAVNGKVLYEQGDGGMGQKGRSGSRHRQKKQPE